MSTSVENLGISLAQDYVQINLNDRGILPTVINEYPFLSRITTMTEKLGPTIYVNKYAVEQYKYGNMRVAPAIKSVALSAGNTIATVTTVDGNFNKIRQDEIVKDFATGINAKVVSHKPGQLVLQVFSTDSGDSVDAFTSSDFAAGNYISVLGPNKNPENSTAMETQLYSPDQAILPIEHMTDSLEMTLQDMFNKSRLPQKNSEGKEFFAFLKDRLFMEQIARETETKIMYGNYRYNGNPQDGNGNEAPGILWQIKNRGGLYKPLTAMPTEDDYQECINWSIDQGGSGESELLVMAGSRAFGFFQNNLTDKYLKYVGNTSTMGGKELKGLNFQEYTFNGRTLLWYNYELFNDPNLNPYPSAIPEMNGAAKSKANMLFIDTTPVSTADQGTLPWISRYGVYGKEHNEGYAWIAQMLNRDGSKSENPNGTKLAGMNHYYMNFLAKVNNPKVHAYLELTV